MKNKSKYGSQLKIQRLCKIIKKRSNNNEERKKPSPTQFKSERIRGPGWGERN